MPNNTHTIPLDFKGNLADWMHVFSAGEHTDSAGRTKQFSRADLDTVVAAHDPKHPAPHVITHKELYSPFAFGQSLDVKREGDELYVKSQKISPQLEKLVEDGHVFSRSIRLLPTDAGYKLGHIAWLGAELPAVEGLDPVEFATNSDAFFDFAFHDSYTPSLAARLFRRLRDFIIDKHDVDTADRVIPEYEVEALSEYASDLRNQPSDDSVASFSKHLISKITDLNKPTDEGDLSMPFTQADIDKAKADGRKDAESDFSSREQDLQNQLNTERSANRRRDFQAQTDAFIDAGTLLPAQAIGVVDFMMQLPDGDDAAFEFSTGDAGNAKTVKTSPAHWFSDFMTSLPKQIDMSRSADEDFVDTSGSDFVSRRGEPVDADRLALDKKARDYMSKHNGVDYVTAVKLVEQGGQ